MGVEMTTAEQGVVTTAEASWPEEIPRNYEELHSMYAPFIATALRRHNKVGRNFEELYSYVWQRLVEKDVIELFMDSVRQKLPRRLTAVQACAFLGITFKQWKTKMWSYHLGVPIYSKHDPEIIIGRRIRGWMPTPLNALDHEMRCREHNAKLIAEGQKPGPVTNGSQSRDAIYDIYDIVELSMLEDPDKRGTVRGRGPFRVVRDTVQPELKATKAHFQAYLSKSIYSDWANWCRTYMRKWEKDRPMFVRETDDPEQETWEQKLRDPAGARQETQIALKQAMGILSTTLHESMRGVDAVALKCKPVKQTEMEMFELLVRGVPLPEVVKKLSVPERVRRNILKSIADIRVRAA